MKRSLKLQAKLMRVINNQFERQGLSQAAATKLMGVHATAHYVVAMAALAGLRIDPKIDRAA